MIKTYAYFVQNTISPMLDRISDIIWLAESKGLPFNRATLSEITEKAFLAHLITLIIMVVRDIGIACLICWTAYKIL